MKVQEHLLNEETKVYSFSEDDISSDCSFGEDDTKGVSNNGIDITLNIWSNNRGDFLMDMDLEKYFQKNESAFYLDGKGEKRFRGVHKYYGDTLRNDKAKNQSEFSPAPICNVFAYVNEFIELLRTENGYSEKNVRFEPFVLDNTVHTIMDNGILAMGLKWDDPIYDCKKKEYVEWDYKYDIIKDKFKLNKPSDIVWIKFTTNGHVGVIAKSFDINFDRKTSDGKPISSTVLVEEVGEKWDKSFVMIFPMTPEIIGNRSIEDLELGIGNYLINKKVPIIDFYSHNN